MENIMKELDSIVAKLNLSTVRPYYREWKGLYKGDKGEKRYIRDYINRYFDEETKECEEEIKSEFSEELRKNDELYAQVAHEIYTNPEPIVKDLWKPLGLWLTYQEKTPEQAAKEISNDDMALKRILRFVINQEYFSGLKCYQKFRKDWVEENRKGIEESLYHSAHYEYEDRKEDIENQTDMSKAYSQLFGSKYRLIPKDLVIEQSEASEGSPVTPEAIKFNRYFPSFCQIYFNLLGKTNEVRRLDDMIIEADYPDFFNTGKYIMEDGRKINVGRIIDSLIKKGISGEEELKWMRKLLSQKSQSKGNKLLYTVISRHPYDIAGMSTDRGWKSCMNLVDGMYSQFVLTSMNGGVLVAYLCSEDDVTNIGGKKNKKINIQNPLGRCLIKPYVKKGWMIDFDNPNFILRCSQTYGTFYDKCVKNLQRWIDYHWNKKIDINDDTYKLDTQSHYPEFRDPNEIEGKGL